MRWLFLDTHVRGEAVFGWLSQDGERIWTQVGRGSSLLGAMSTRIKTAELVQAQGICVVTGPGPFSAIRLGVLAANLISRTCGLPLYAVDSQAAVDRKKLGAELAQGAVPRVEYAAPVYDSEPNITLPKT